MNYCTAILLAAGGGTRFDATRAKQTYQLLGKSVLRRSAEALAFSASVDAIVAVVRKEDIPFAEAELAGLSVPVTLVIGGETRQASAAIGFSHIPSQTTEVLIHDAARCLITSAGVDAVADAVRKHGAASAVTAVNDTVKLLDETCRIVSTFNRDRLCFAATPQGFAVSLYQKALANAEKEKKSVTDDNMLIESLGESVYPVYVSGNPKITTPDDMLYAEFLLQKRGKSNG